MKRTAVHNYQVSLVANAPQQVLGPNPERQAVIINPGSSSANTLAWSFGNAETDYRGIVYVGFQVPMLLTREQLGTAIEEPLFAISNLDGALARATEWTTLP